MPIVAFSTPVLAVTIGPIKSGHPNWSVAMIKSVIMTIADTLDGVGLPIADEKSNSYNKVNFFAMGAGHVILNNAVNPTLPACVD